MAPIEQQNEWLLRAESMLLEFPRCVSRTDVASLMEMDIGESDAVSMLIAGILGLDIADNPSHRNLFETMIRPSVEKIDDNRFADNYFLNTIKCTETTNGDIVLRQMTYAPYELMPCGDLRYGREGRIVAPIGYFDHEWTYPALLENGRIWMSATPNEIITMEEPLSRARGEVVVLGLGIGYFAVMAAQKEEVEKVTVIEINRRIIDVVESVILPQTDYKSKIEIICGDALEYMKMGGCADFLFADIWHDVGDGLSLYGELKSSEHLWPGAECCYWIEPSMKMYL